jgi:hypothetical protein
MCTRSLRTFGQTESGLRHPISTSTNSAPHHPVPPAVPALLNNVATRSEYGPASTGGRDLLATPRHAAADSAARNAESGAGLQWCVAC